MPVRAACEGPDAEPLAVEKPRRSRTSERSRRRVARLAAKMPTAFSMMDHSMMGMEVMV